MLSNFSDVASCGLITIQSTHKISAHNKDDATNSLNRKAAKPTALRRAANKNLANESVIVGIRKRSSRRVEKKAAWVKIAPCRGDELINF